MVLVRMRQDERVDPQPPIHVALEAITKLIGDIREVVVGVICGAADVAVNQQCLAALEREKRHVAVAHSEMARRRRHPSLLRPGSDSS